MHQLSDKRIKEFKDIIEKESGKDISWEEASEGARGLMQLAELALKQALEEQKRKKKLEESPKGFHLEGIGYSCAICGNHISNEETWYDKYGIKCLICQKAVDKKIIPGSAVRDRESWYSKWDLESRFNIDRHALKRLVTAGILKPRNVLDESGRIHAQIFLIKDNEDTLPPKKLTDSHSVKETKDGKDWFTSEPWYKFVDPYKHLAGYKIMNHLKAIYDEPKDK